jgi:hypothetical protein
VEGLKKTASTGAMIGVFNRKSNASYHAIIVLATVVVLSVLVISLEIQYCELSLGVLPL